MRKCSNTLLANATSTLPVASQPRSCAGPQWVRTSGAAWRATLGSMSSAHFSRGADVVHELAQSGAEVDEARVGRHPALEEILAQHAPEGILGAPVRRR